MIWTKEGLGINFLRMQLQMMSRYPDYIFKMAIRFTMTYGLPVLMSGSFSVNAILYPENGIKLIISLILTNLIFFFINRITWKVALNHYESASS
jgi:ABC-2 type transport system permease protein